MGRREFVISSAVSATASLGLRAASPQRPESPGVRGVGLFVAESGRVAALDGARFAAGQGIPVLLFEPDLPMALVDGLRAAWITGAARVVGLTSARAYAIARDVAAELGYAIESHAAHAEAGDESLFHWTVAPQTV